MPISNPVTLDLQAAIGEQLPESSRRTSSHVGKLLWAFFEEFKLMESRLAGLDIWRWDQQKTEGLYFAFRDGRAADGKGGLIEYPGVQLLLTASNTNYIQMQPDVGIIANTSGFVAGNFPLYIATTSGSAVATVTDKRPWHGIIHGKVVGAADLSQELLNILPTVDFHVEAELSNFIDATLYLVDMNDATAEENHVAEIWLSDAPYGWETATSPSVHATPENILEIITAKKRWRIQTLAEFGNGCAVTINHVGAHTWYLNAMLDDGRVFCSDAIIFT